jgi:rRNA pseudouridine-1189 N-methylase Emg1 (Nep1/Mra1 family)
MVPEGPRKFLPVLSTVVERGCTPTQGTNQLAMEQNSEQKPEKKLQNPHVFVVLERACLETYHAGKQFSLLNSEDHQGYLRESGRHLGEARPDIVHQVYSQGR